MSVMCTHCGSSAFIKKGTTARKDGRIFLCKKCGKRFTIGEDDLKGTNYVITAEEKSKAVLSAKKESVKDTTSKKVTITNNNHENTGGFDMGKAKRDKNGNYLLRIGRNGVASPVGSSYEELMRIVESNANCTLTLDSDGIFTLNVVTTTKG